MRRLRAGIPAIALLFLTFSPARGETYDTCIELAQTDPARAEQFAQSWEVAGGGAAARHCHAQAQIALGAYRNAIETLTDLGQREASLPDRTRSEILLQAGELLLAEAELESAALVANQALELRKSRDGYALLAVVQATQRRWRSVIETVNLGIDFAGPDAALLIPRATARRNLGQAVPARADAIWALEFRPGDAEALLELGRIEQSLGNKPAARDAFLKAIASDRAGSVSEAARLSLQEMDGGG